MYKTHCKNGHKRTKENTYMEPHTGSPSCKICRFRAKQVYEYGGNREIVIVRDGEKCVKCGMTRAEHRKRFKRDITIDHIDGNGSNQPKSLKNNDLNNLQTLCYPCHHKKDYDPNKVPKGDDHPMRVLNSEDVADIKTMLLQGYLLREIASKYGVTNGNIGYIAVGKIWKGVKPLNENAPIVHERRAARQRLRLKRATQRQALNELRSEL